ncbi:MAG TPA: hypothetical protein ENJ46_00570 [Hellea balneolensis]|uniref:Uncharacterized protein n=1 Tax=Hellea balneolensis TaxID=287478 RepID=A0A7C3C4U3_9PROT|nr:hypothetical protein [Hellea balneolensis]
MQNLLDFLSQKKILLLCFMAMLLIGYGFNFTEPLIGGELLDMQMNAADAQARLAEMSSYQRKMHLLTTLILDSLYPLAYGGLLAGIVGRFAHNRQRLWAAPAVFTVFIDFCENGVQSLALMGHENLLGLKGILTPLKFGGFALAALIVIVLLLAAAYRKITSKE